LVNLRLLIGVKVKRIYHALETILSRNRAATSPSLVGIQRESASGDSEKENEYRREANLPLPFVGDVHTYLQLPGNLSRRLFVAAVDRSQQLAF
jgi:hypothetical protein